MLFNLSIEADDPRHVAETLARLMGGSASPFHAVVDGAWCAMAHDAHGMLIAVYPRGTEVHEVEGDADATGVAGAVRRHGATHFALGTQMDVEDVFVLAADEGWPAKYRKRDGRFGVIEMWVERCLMIEVMTPALQAEYLAAFAVPAMRLVDKRLPRAA